MPPKKKTNKKGGDDWEAELGDPAPHVEDAAPNAGAEAGEDEFPAGGLMAAMKKNRNKKKAKGKPTDDFGDANGGETPADEVSTFDPSIKAPAEATMEEEFSLPTKGKGKGAGKSVPAEDDGDDERGADGRVMTKKEKEKAKKEREKQRKKEQVRTAGKFSRIIADASETPTGGKEEDHRTGGKGCRSSKTRCRVEDRGT